MFAVNCVIVTFVLSPQLQLYDSGAQVVGWDMEWNMNWKSLSLKHGGKHMFQRLGTGNLSKQKGTVVLLAHDVAFQPNPISGGLGSQAELEAFLDAATQAGYKFDTLDALLLQGGQQRRR